MVPAGITGKVVEQLAELMEDGDIIIDGGNSNYREDIDRAAALKPKGIHYVDIGTSGGVWGLERGYCLMIGGEDDAVAHFDPLLARIAPGLGDIERTPGRSRRPGAGGAGLPALRPERRRALREDGPQRHRVRDDGRLRRGPQRPAPRRTPARRSRAHSAEETPLDQPQYYQYDLDLAKVAEVWRRGSVSRPGCSTSPPARCKEPGARRLRRPGLRLRRGPLDGQGRDRRGRARAGARRRRCSPGSPAAARRCTPTSCCRPCARSSAGTWSCPPASSALARGTAIPGTMAP